MSKSMREELADRLRTVFCDGPGSEYQFRVSEIAGDAHGSAEMNQEGWLDMADECIRQMEWTRTVCVSSTQALGLSPSPIPPQQMTDWAEITGTLPLTLAPKDWKP